MSPQLRASQKTKPTPAGELPVDWGCVPLREVVAVLESGVSVLTNDQPASCGEPAVLKVSAVKGGKLIPQENKAILPYERARAATNLVKGSVLISRSNTPDLVGSVGFVDKDRQDLFLPDTLWQIRFKERAEVDGRWINFVLSSTPFRMLLRQIASGTSANMKKLQKPSLLRVCLPHPPLPEQRKIADILTTWDEALTQLDALIEAQERRKKALMQQLLTGRRRLKGFSKPWKHKRLDAVFERVDRAIEGEPEHVLSITAGRGFVDQREKFSRVIAGRNIENYVLLKKGEFSYNKGNSDRYPQGCLYRLEEFEEGAVPNVWISFRLRAETDSPLFYKHFFLYGGLNHGLHRLINAGVRNDGLLNLTASNFFSVTVPAPEPAEQAKLGDLFENLSISIKNLRDQRTALDQQKRGLMQRLLTGKLRVKP